MNRSVGLWWCTAVLNLTVVAVAQAEVTVESTRTVFPAAQQEVSVRLKNEGDAPSLVQAWISDGDLAQGPEASKAPFIIDRPLLRLEPHGSYSLRVRRIPQNAPLQKREYLYWLNVLEIPPRVTTADSTVQIAVRLRMKVFYRPEGVEAPVNPDRQVSMLAGTDGLQLHNASIHYFNIGEMILVSAVGEREVGSLYLAPGETRTLPLPVEWKGRLMAVRYAWLDDDGALHPQKRDL